ncbi:hypothetical protein [Hufsiella ginkgonis]|uniref:Uncharacterized protein n=1 Tax=Hufsiella ginkgonis TaxID=2695274 RepID=A0A7K1Y1H8_9SPHI|nr:hypothetical protein [Hufsiella ginkgonis]MXV16938.1 hypothetical protein [Hufsiella ginkgonis]
MSKHLITTDPFALRTLMTEDLYQLHEPAPAAIMEVAAAAEKPVPHAAAAADIPAVSAKQEAAFAPSFNYLGENNRFFLLLVNEPGHMHADAKTIDTLTLILKGKQLEVRDIALLNLAGHPQARFADMKSFFMCSKMVIFGIDPTATGLPPTPGNTITVHEGVKVLATYSIKEMQADEQKKRAFWAEMKKL